MTKTIKVKKIPIGSIQHLSMIKGHAWFSPDNTRFFNSRYPKEAVQKEGSNEAFFVSSEKFNFESPREFSVRKVNLQTGDIDTVGEFGQFKSKGDAIKKLRDLIK